MRYRKERMASVIREVVSDAIARHIHDPRLAPLTTVSRVTVSGDLSLATVFVAVAGGEALERRSMAALQHARGFVQRLIAERLQLRQCPELRLELDEVVKKARQTLLLLAENKAREPHLYEEQGPAPGEEGHRPDDDTPDEGGTAKGAVPPEEAGE